MRALFGFSVIQLTQKWKRARWISLGLESVQIQLSDGTSLHYWVLQNNKPKNLENQRLTLLLIHGFGADGLLGWDTQICDLGKHFDLLIPDVIFSGDSTTTSTEWSEILQAECMKGMVEFLGIESVIVVGHSYGGFIAFWMGHKYPNLVQRLIIISSVVFMTPSTYDSLLEEYDYDDIKNFLAPIDAKGLKISLNVDFYKFPWLPHFIYEDLWQVMEGNREQKVQLADAIVIGLNNMQALPTMNQDRFFRLEEAYVLQRHIEERDISKRGLMLW